MRPIALLLACLAVAACTHAATGVTLAGPEWRATVTTVPWPPRGITPHRVIVTFQGRQVSGPVRLRMRMPDMSHESKTATLRATGSGRYEGTVTFDMAGTWELTLLAGTPPEQASTTLTAEP